MKSGLDLALSSQTLERLAPFHVVWDRTGHVRHVSAKASAYFGLQRDGATSEFQLEQPFCAPLTADLLAELTNMILFVGQGADSERLLKGELIPLDGGEGWLLSGMPPVTSVSELDALGLQLHELPLHQGIGDLLLANEAARISLAESQRANQELKAAQRVLVQQEQLKALGEMASGIAHDFNNTIAPIVHCCSVLESYHDIPIHEMTESLRLIRTAAEDAAAMTRRLRSLYKPTLAVGELKHFSINTLVEDAIALARSKVALQSSHGGVLAITRALGANGEVQGEKTDIRQALLNLLINAIDALEDDLHIEVKTWSNDVTVFVSITDHGVGLGPEELERCRQPFFSTKGERGSGLGLPMVIQAVARQGGEMNMESERGVGTTVTLSLPRSPKAPLDDVVAPVTPRLSNPPRVPESSPASTPSQRPRKRAKDAISLSVLLVDDDPRVLRSFQRALERRGHHVVSTQDSLTVLSRVEEHEFDLILSDVNMPGMRGDDLAVRIRTSDPDAVIMLYSGDPDSIHIDGVRAANAIFGKPVSPSAVLAKGLECLGL